MLYPIIVFLHRILRKKILLMISLCVRVISFMAEIEKVRIQTYGNGAFFVSLEKNY
jgi:hypothetical protein